MKKILLTIALMLNIFYTNAQSVSQPMNQYIQGCDMLLSGIIHKSFVDILDAVNILTANHLKLLQFEDFDSLDKDVSERITLPYIMFTPDFAIEISKSDKIEDAYTITNPYIMRKGDEYNLQIWNAAIQPKTSASFKAKGVEACELLLLSSASSSLSLSVSFTDKEVEVESQTLTSSKYTVANWYMDKVSDYYFTITNNGDKIETFVLATN